MSLSGFQRRRREQAAKLAKEAEEKAKVLEEHENATEGQNGAEKGTENEVSPKGNENGQEKHGNDPDQDGGQETGQEKQQGQENPVNEVKLTPGEVDDLAIETVKSLLDAKGVKYAHNTGDAKLREKLKDAIE